jgi:hypothetical protein
MLDGEGRSQEDYLRSRSPESREMAKTTANHTEMRICGRLETGEGWRWGTGSRGGDKEEPRSRDGEAQIYHIFYSPEGDGKAGAGGGSKGGAAEAKRRGDDSSSRSQI